MKLAKEVTASSDATDLITAFHWVSFIQGSSKLHWSQAGIKASVQRVWVHAHPVTPEPALLLNISSNIEISSVGRDPQGSASPSWACTRQPQKSHHVSERIVQTLLISGRCHDQDLRKALRNTGQQGQMGIKTDFTACFISQVFLAQGSAWRCKPLSAAKPPPVKLLPIPHKSTDNWIPTDPLHFRQQRRCPQSFCGIVHFSWKGRGLEALPKPWNAGFWILALSPLCPRMLHVLLLSLPLKTRASMSRTS